MPNSKGERKNTRDKLSNRIRERGASPPSGAVQEFDEGDKVHVTIDASVPEGRPHPKFQGRTGTVVGKQGRAFEIEVSDGKSEKTLFVRPQHLAEQEG
ncbi:MAG: 50S ribosomal protein L21e [Halobacteriales archaeon]|nr:50S ribosomal protein L21e [Halobacteriales archaeon]